MLEQIDWECEVERIYHERNLGCSATIELGLDHVFSRVPEAIVLEDDCTPDPSFFRYCAELLERYRGDPSIHQIAGFALDTPRALFEGASYALSTVSASWGWASWADRWQAHRRRVPRGWDAGTDGTLELGGRGLPEQFGVLSGGLRWWYRDIARMAVTEAMPWDNVWGLSVASVDGRAITPALNMVENTGFAPDGTHNRTAAQLPLARSMPFPLVHPPASLNVPVARELEFDGLWFPVGKRIRRARLKLPVGPIRTTIVRVLTSASVIRARAYLWRLRARVT